MSTVLYFVTKPCGTSKTTLWPMSSYGEICTSQAAAETEFDRLLSGAKSGTSLSLESQKAVLKNGQVEKTEGAATVLKTVKK